MKSQLILSGDANIPELQMTDAQVNHLRRLLAWMRVEYCLDENMQKGCVDALEFMVKTGVASPERAGELLTERAKQINHVPAYIRQGIKMLTKALREHDKQAGVIESKEHE